MRPLECRPLGADSGEGSTLRAFWREHCNGWVTPEALDDWWVADYKNPTWDLIVVCERDTVAVAVVEAKAHESELDWKGKRALVEEADSARHGERPAASGRLSPRRRTGSTGVTE